MKSFHTVVGFSQTMVTVTEGADTSFVTLTVFRNGGLTLGANVSFTTIQGTAEEGMVASFSTHLRITECV